MSPNHFFWNLEFLFSSVRAEFWNQLQRLFLCLFFFLDLFVGGNNKLMTVFELF